MHDALDDITPFAYLSAASAIATLLLAPFAVPALRARRRRTRAHAGPRRRSSPGVILFGGYATQTVGLQYTSPSTSAFITGLYVVITPVIESRDQPTAAAPAGAASGIVIATVGLYLLTGADVHLGRGELVHARVRGAVRVPHRVHRRATRTGSAPTQFTALQIGAVALLSIAARRPRRASGTLSALAVVRGRVHRRRVLGDRAAVAAVGSAVGSPRPRAALILLVGAGVRRRSPATSNGERLGAGRLAGGVVILVGHRGLGVLARGSVRSPAGRSPRLTCAAVASEVT